MNSLLKPELELLQTYSKVENYSLRYTCDFEFDTFILLIYIFLPDMSVIDTYFVNLPSLTGEIN